MRALRFLHSGLPLLLLAVLSPATAQQPPGDIPHDILHEGPGLEEAEAMLEAGDVRAAAVAFGRLATRDPGDGRAWFGLARARREQGSLAEAMAAFRRAWEAGYNPGRVAYHAARAAAAAGDREAALAWLGRLADTGSTAHLAVVNAPELQGLVGTPEYEEVLERLRPCGGAAYRAFDFWLGEWRVVNRAGAEEAPPSRSRVTSEQDGCALRERYTAPSGYAGGSVTFYDRGAELWHQVWIDNQGRSLFLAGGLAEDGSMVLSETIDAVPINRIVWTPLPGGRVRQLWEVSSDEGESWTLVFDGLYTPVGGGAGGAAGDEADGGPD